MHLWSIFKQNNYNIHKYYTKINNIICFCNKMVFTFIIFSIFIVILVFYSMYNKGTIDLLMLNSYLIKIFGKKTVEFL